MLVKPEVRFGWRRLALGPPAGGPGATPGHPMDAQKVDL